MNLILCKVYGMVAFATQSNIACLNIDFRYYASLVERGGVNINVVGLLSNM